MTLISPHSKLKIKWISRIDIIKIKTKNMKQKCLPICLFCYRTPLCEKNGWVIFPDIESTKKPLLQIDQKHMLKSQCFENHYLNISGNHISLDCINHAIANESRDPYEH